MKFSDLIWAVQCLTVLDFVDSPLACNPAEYRIGDECCPMCSPGNRVYKHCTEYTSTSCVPCVGSTYLDEPNGLIACIQCSYCDPGFGLTVKHPCTPISDTVCEPLEGFYCTDPNKDGCKAAERHSSCKPGQYIRQKGTSLRDTVCANCTGDTYSNGSLTSCQPHTQCEALKLIQIKSGNHWTDATCGQQTSSLIVPIISVFIIALILIAVVVVIRFYKKKLLQCCTTARSAGY
ncbi:hypothetical protein UPYG_G00004570 [Umbra pygmaea]|uniref:TNFR-Cys domain-containing protein n=1 Tax=Umbra pygmaea TaxID=75934 RepID=A0ABD0XW61_UMBPY